MTSEATKQTFAQLGVKSPEKIPAMFAEVRAAFDRELSAATDEANWKSVRDAWLGRKSGVLSQVTDNWLKPAAPDLKRVVLSHGKNLESNPGDELRVAHATM